MKIDLPRFILSCLIVLVCATVAEAENLEHSIWRNPLPTGGSLYAVAHGNGLFVALGDGEIRVSRDGTAWTRVETGASDMLTGIAFGKGRFVAVTLTEILTSEDGKVWIVRMRSSGGKAFFDVEFINNQFIAVGGAYDSSVIRYIATIMTSADGITWNDQNRSRSVHGQIKGIAYGNGMYVGVGTGTGFRTVVTSPDGVRWTTRNATVPEGAIAEPRGIAFGHDLFVAVGSQGGTDTLLGSTDGITWEILYKAGAGGGFEEIRFLNNVFAAVGEALVVSPDGWNWYPVDFLTRQSVEVTDITNAPGLYVAVGRYGLTLKSTDGIMWDRTNTAFTSDTFRGLAYCDGSFVAIDQNRDVFVSRDGLSWLLSANMPRSIYGLACIDDRLFAPAYGRLFVSDDAVVWERVDLEGSFYLNDVSYGNGIFVTGGQRILVSPDGMNWEETIPAVGESISERIRDIAFGNGLFVAAIPSFRKSRIIISPDGRTWADATIPEGSKPEQIAYGNGIFVAVGLGGTLLRSTDGRQWSDTQPKQFPDDPNQPPTSHKDVAYGSGYFVVVGVGRSMISEDGKSWSLLSQMQPVLSTAVVYGRGTFMTAALGGVLIQAGPACEGTLATNLTLHLPLVSFGGEDYWVDLVYTGAQGLHTFALAAFGAVTDPSFYDGCQKALFGNDQVLRVPAIVVNGVSYRIELEHAGSFLFSLEGAAVN